MKKQVIREGDMFSNRWGSYMLFDRNGQHNYLEDGDYIFNENEMLLESVGGNMEFLTNGLSWEYEGNLMEGE